MFSQKSGLLGWVLPRPVKLTPNAPRRVLIYGWRCSNFRMSAFLDLFRLIQASPDTTTVC
eukprot:4172936-Amphidinium_carterae.1